MIVEKTGISGGSSRGWLRRSRRVCACAAAACGGAEGEGGGGGEGVGGNHCARAERAKQGASRRSARRVGPAQPAPGRGSAAVAMNNFHIYEQIGRGKHSVVYKSRRKKTIQYYAVKSVDKSQKARVLQEVRILHALRHEAVLRFHAWYETSNHLWLILEYCVGGDMSTLLKQDGVLPEASVHDFGRGLADALYFLHSQGIVYVALRPSNVLLDEDGRLKLCDFGNALRLTDIERAAARGGAGPAAKHGTGRGAPCYMAPELFADGSFHSFASDLWALGCVIYECVTGTPPFVDSSFQKLVAMILDDETPPLPEGTSPALVGLVSKLLEKDPAKRIGWSEVRVHPVWRVPLHERKLPAQPAFEAFLRKSRLAAAVTAPDGRGAAGVEGTSGTKAVHKLEQHAVDAPVSRNAGHALAGGVDQVDKENAARTSTARASVARRTSGVDVLRLSIAARDNQDDEEVEGYVGKAGGNAVQGHAPGNSAFGHDDNDGDVALSDTETELNFETGVGGGGEANNKISAGVVDHANSAGADRTTPGEDGADDVAPTDISADEPDASAFGRTSRSRRSGPWESAVAPDGPLSVGSNGHDKAAGDLANGAQDGEHAVGEDSTPQGSEARTCSAASVVEELLWHRSDQAVKPIVHNRRIEKVAEPTYDRRLLPFRASALDEMLAMAQPELEDFLTQVYRSLSGSVPLQERLNSLCYFETLCSNQSAANVLINSSLMGLLVRILRSAKSPALRARLAAVMGTLLRHATYIAEELAQSGVAEALTEALGERDERLKRRAMAALGELLFYVATQAQEAGMVSGAGNGGRVRPSPWHIPHEVVGAMTQLLRPGEDEVAAHYAAKTIENVASGTGEWPTRVSTVEMATNLASLYSTCRSEQLRATVAGALARVLRQRRGLAAGVMRHSGGAKLLARGVADPQGRASQAMASIACVALMDTSSGEAGRPAIVLTVTEERLLLPPLLACLEQSAVVLRGKACLALLLLVSRSPRALRQACASRLLPTLDRLAADSSFMGNDYGADALRALQAECVSTATAIIDSTVSELRKRRTQSQQNQSRGGGALALFPAVLFVVGSASLRVQAANDALIDKLGELVRLTLAPRVSGGVFSPSSVPLEFATCLLQTVEACASQPDLLLERAAAVTSRLLPPLADAVAGGSVSELRFQALRTIGDLLGPILSTPGTYDAYAREVADACILRLGPVYSDLLSDEEPIPLCTLKLLGSLMERDAARYAVAAARSGLIPHFVSFLSVSSMLCNVHNIKLVRHVLQLDESELPTTELVSLQASAAVAGVLEYAATNTVEPFLEPALAIAAALLRRGADTTDKLAPLAPLARELEGHPSAHVAEAAAAFAACLQDAAGTGTEQ